MDTTCTGNGWYCPPGQEIRVEGAAREDRLLEEEAVLVVACGSGFNPWEHFMEHLATEFINTNVFLSYCSSKCQSSMKKKF